MKRIKVNIDGYQIEAIEGQSILQAALHAGIYIPHLCYHPDLSPQGNCKLCAVEIEGRSGVVQSCETCAEEGMKIYTATEQVKHLRQVALELILASHPKDCTSCAAYLNCELQALMQYMGVAHSRMKEIHKEHNRIGTSDPLIQKEMFRCIQCGRCIRACQELRGVGVLQYNKKEGETYVGTKDDVPLAKTDCRFCGACVEVCPTGSIMDAQGVFSKDSPRQLALVACKDKCPAHTDIPTYVRLAEEGKYSESVSVFREKLTFPHSLGYICTHPCEGGCKRGRLNGAVSIREIKKFAVEHDETQSWKKRAFHNPPTGKQAAVVGGGPAGMTAAFYLAKKGHAVTVFERQPLAGGMLSYGIPKYRLPQEIVDNEVEILKEAGIDVRTGTNIESVNELKDKGYDAIVIAVGAQKGKRPPGYDKPWANGYTAVDFLRLAMKGPFPELGNTVTVYGGGNVAFDCALTAKKEGIAHVNVVCLEAREEMLADKEEVAAALDLGVAILNKKTLESIEEKNGKVASLHLKEVESFRFAEKGLELELVSGSETSLKTDSLIFATGQQTELDEGFGLELLKGSFLKTDAALQTSEAGVYAAGDVVTGTRSVVEAIASGRNAARSVDRYLGGDGNIEEILYDREGANPQIGVIEGFAQLERRNVFGSCRDAQQESARCLQCDLRLQIQQVKFWGDAHYKQVKEAEG
ncbi:FAD-dependent oxidoreductase [Aminipila butyrica]|uniref:FAD-dependent oxidoreductase n=1 Tax=Aminipila butyrica TaxID=433296 RepID=A0A858BT14_9FIRM|nr:FAD-dependent oxidoreductase [Aminipila butyrica]QIB68707.1 FAD-dependent oxidoreductase [Aminipila butyrica]